GKADISRARRMRLQLPDAGRWVQCSRRLVALGIWSSRLLSAKAAFSSAIPGVEGRRTKSAAIGSVSTLREVLTDEFAPCRAQISRPGRLRSRLRNWFSATVGRVPG